MIQLSTASTEDAKNPPNPGSVTDMLPKETPLPPTASQQNLTSYHLLEARLSQGTSPTTAPSLSHTNNKYRDLYKKHQYLHKTSSHRLSIHVLRRLGIHQPITTNLMFPHSIKAFCSDLYTTIMTFDASVIITKALLFEFHTLL